MDVRPTLVADAKPPVLVGPGDRPLHRPAGLTQPALVVDPLLGQDRLDAEFPQPLAVWLGVVGQIPLQGVGLLPGVADLARHRRDGRANWLTSLPLAAVTELASGIPPASVIRWCLLPGLDRSTGLGPVASPP
jgi:hypothetical protein